AMADSSASARGKCMVLSLLTASGGALARRPAPTAPCTTCRGRRRAGSEVVRGVGPRDSFLGNLYVGCAWVRGAWRIPQRWMRGRLGGWYGWADRGSPAGSVEGGWAGWAGVRDGGVGSPGGGAGGGGV